MVLVGLPEFLVGSTSDWFSGFAAVVGSQGGEDDEGSVNQYGFLVQGAWRFDPRWEVALRYEYGDADQRAQDLSIISLGLNHYIADHSLKWQNDIGFALNELATNASKHGSLALAQGRVNVSWRVLGDGGWCNDDPGRMH